MYFWKKDLESINFTCYNSLWSLYFSKWNKIDSQVHCCEEDFMKKYNDEIRAKIIKYHDNSDFVTEWRTFDEVMIHKNIHERAKENIDKRDADTKGKEDENTTK